jgi:hypothetical protein
MPFLQSNLETIQFFKEGEPETDYAIGKVTMNKVSDRFAAKDLKRELKAYFVTFHDGLELGYITTNPTKY